MKKDQEGMKFWLNAESVTAVTSHRIPVQHLASQNKVINEVYISKLIV